MEQEAIKENFRKNLKPTEYVASLETNSKRDMRFIREPLIFIHGVLASGRFKGSRLLDLGSGAVVRNVASASAFFPDIIMSDYVEANCEELKRWLKGESTLRQQFLEIPAELEGFGGNLEAGVQMLENRIRKNVKQVVRCDVLEDNVFLEEVKPDVAPPYDLIISILCLECCPTDFDGFILILKRVNKLLRPGGGLILSGLFEGDKWKVEETYFNHIQLSEQDLMKALKDSGFGNIDLKAHGKLDFDYEHKGLYSLAANKM